MFSEKAKNKQPLPKQTVTNMNNARCAYLTMKRGASFYFSAVKKSETYTPLTIEQAKNLEQGDIIYFENKRFKVTSVKTFKRNPDRIIIGLKHGLYTYCTLDETELHLFSLFENK